jgi:hypothetical protein
VTRVVLDGMTVENVEAVADDAEGFLVPDDTFVGPGFTWDGGTESPVFTSPTGDAG